MMLFGLGLAAGVLLMSTVYRAAEWTHERIMPTSGRALHQQLCDDALQHAESVDISYRRHNREVSGR